MVDKPGVSVGLRGLGKAFPGGVEALRGIDLEVAAGSFLVILGPSGCGKTTLLRLIAGLEAPTAGAVFLGCLDVTPLPPRRRDVAMVFQTPALYPHLSVFDNLAFGLRARGANRSQVAERVTEAARALGIGGLLGRRPQALSGGERQRVALGRAVARRPAVCLFDEPLAALDLPLRAAVRSELTRLHTLTGATFIHVTHDQAEAMAIADKIAVMESGRIVQVGPPREVYDRPATRFVGTFLGSPPMNMVPGAWLCDAPIPPGLSRDRLEVGVRPEHVRLARLDAPHDPSFHWLRLALSVSRVEDLGHEALVTLGDGPVSVVSRQPGGSEWRAEETISVGLDLKRASWFQAGTGTAVAHGES